MTETTTSSSVKLSTERSLHDDSNADPKLQFQEKVVQAMTGGRETKISSSEDDVLEKNDRHLRLSTSDATRQRTRDEDLEHGDAVDQSVVNPNDTENNDTEDANVVWWDGPNDPENPYNWPSWRKWTNCGLISTMTLLTPLASSMFAPGVPQVMAEFGSDSLEIASFVVSVYVLGFAAGPMLFAPLSEIYGRIPIYHISTIGFVAFTVGCALSPSLNALIVFRFFCGVCGSTPITIGGGSIADMIVQEKRGAVMSGFSMGPLLGPVIGPIAGGFLANAEGWRWTFWVLAMVIGLTGLLMMALLKESYTPVLMARRAARRQNETGNTLLRSKLDMGLSPSDFFKRGIVRPMKMLSHSPIIVPLPYTWPLTTASYTYSLQPSLLFSDKHTGSPRILLAYHSWDSVLEVWLVYWSSA
ncbi:major facilitator superfamily domain-containing protein [Xylariaceae sp. FL0016]|nr:major facilitator superfamily domain-containing protein [Xylariaceae sp. FL0016]